jgi:hypothetical protein
VLAIFISRKTYYPKGESVDDENFATSIASDDPAIVGD